MRNVKRFIAGTLAAVMMISSAQIPGGMVYAAEDEVIENEVIAEDNQADEPDNNDADDTVEAQNDTDDEQIDTDEQNNQAADNDGEDDKDDEIVTDVDNSITENTEIVDGEDVDDEDVDDEDVDEEIVDEDIVDDETTEQITDEDIEVIEEAVVQADLTTTSVDYDAVEDYIVKQLIAERKKNPNTTEITIDISSYKVPCVTNTDIGKFANILESLYEDRSGDLYFFKRIGTTYYRQQNIITKVVVAINTEVDETKFQNGLKAALATVNDNMSDFQKIVVLHDYLVLTCKYDKTANNCSNIYGALVEGAVKCEGYAKAYKYLLNQLGIECYTVVNDTHMWNLIKLDGEYYHIDVTKDDPTPDKTGRVNHKYMLCSDTVLQKTHGSWKVEKKYNEYVDLKATSTLYDSASWKSQTTPIEFDEISDDTPKVEEPEAETYTITYVLNDGVNHSDNPDTYTKGTAVEFKDPTREGYQFDGWYLNANFTTKVTALSKYSSGDTTIYAKWIRIESTEDETTDEETTEIESSEDETTTEESSEDETTESESSEETSEDETTESVETVETYTITYVLNGGTNNSENPDTYVKGTRVEFKDPTREGYQFDGWYLNANFTTKVASLSKNSSGDTTIYAKWIEIENPKQPEQPKEQPENKPEQVKTYKVTFNTNGRGTAPKAYTNIEVGSTIARPADPESTGYRFDGWYKNAACTKAWDFESDTVEANTTLYAKWTYEGNGELDARAIPDMYYTGSACKPVVDVYDDETLLKAGKDYQVKYYNNVNANIGGVLKSDSFDASLPYVEITGKGNYTGTVKVNFNILKAPISNVNGNPADDVELKVTSRFVASNKAKKPFSSIKLGRTMKQGVDFTLRLTTSDGTELSGAVIPAGLEGTFQLDIIGKNNYEGAIETTIYVADKASLPAIEKFTANTVNVSGITDKVYTGKALVQDNVTLTYGGRQLVRGMDYTVSYAKNVNKGTATMTFKGLENGGFSGSFKKTFKITAASITTASYTNDLTASYSKAGAKPAVTLTSEAGVRLVNGKDYTLSYANNKAVGSGTVIVKGKGGYTGSLSIPFSIVKADLNDLTVKTVPVAYNAKKAADYAYKPVIKLMDGSTTLRAGVDYQIEYQNNTQAAYEAYRNGGTNTPQAVITAKAGSAYELDGEIVIPLPVYQNKLTKNNVSVTVEASECVYTGCQVKPSVEVSFMGTKLTEGKDYMVSYGTNNVSGKNKGNVTISGIGSNYGGDVVVKFEISKKAISY